MQIIKTADQDFSVKWKALRDRLSIEGVVLADPERMAVVRKIIDQVRNRGDQAISELTEKFDGIALKPVDFRIPPDQLAQAHDQLDAKLLEACRQSVSNVKRYQQHIAVKQPPDLTDTGIRLGLRQRPIRRVGICIPGASAPLLSTVIMTAVPALVAGVREIAVISSPSHEGSIHPSILGLCHELGITEVYRISGAQGVAALGLGTESVPKVDKIVGPSSWWGQMAKKELYGLVDIDSIAGPSEVLIIADDTARADSVAADMLSQAEHDPGSAVLVTDSRKLANDVDSEIERQLAKLSRSEGTRRCLEEYSAIIIAGNTNESAQLANEFAAEHLQIITADPESVANEIDNAGAIFLGSYSPVALGDYYAGPSHALPTGSSARFFGPLCVNDFYTWTSVTQYDANALKQAADAIGTLADTEGLDAHKNSVDIRFCEDLS